ncbi:hypothetical protein [Demequina lignilytica]|uniref:Uncharacterized protein n=1 Tax=Demequina lignilytica TaxID=3051663 RepID=A0AB35MJH4_9MICO|nr:hypothetical protein [Demequina sp. SYSU T0a273]MDN4483913.1 hypothetical protein [Demequina sp. SYSU T0a273]
MADATLPPCILSQAGHALHPIQLRLARNAATETEYELLGERPDGIYVVRRDATSPVETWCMHQQWRDVARRAFRAGVTEVIDHTHSLATINGTAVSYTTPEHWRECPPPGELTPWERGFLTRAELAAYLRARSAGDGS